MQRRVKLLNREVPVELQLSLGAPVARTEASRRNGETKRGKVFNTAAGEKDRRA